MNFFDEMITAQKHHESRGITSICSAHPSVIEAAFSQALEHESFLLIESTCNQVNQYGGYTGMTPPDFVAYIQDMAEQFKFPKGNLILGGDHLGPEVWQEEPAEIAMEKARVLVREYVDAGYQKIHLDASMKLGDDPIGPLAIEVGAERVANLAGVAEDTWNRHSRGEAPRYVIGSEVPVPGGAKGRENHAIPTSVSTAEETLLQTKKAFYDLGLESAWERVIAMVVQPGVEFGHDFILDYDPGVAQALSRYIQGKNLVYEAHSTDYQTLSSLQRMVRDHFAILKVGPALTFAYREAVIALAMMEEELISENRWSNLIEVLDQVMVSNPIHWQKYYHGDPAQQQFARLYSFSDRCRYYWTHPKLQDALKRLIHNFQKQPIPLALISQFLPAQYEHIRQGKLVLSPKEIVKDKIIEVLENYRIATSYWEINKSG